MNAIVPAQQQAIESVKVLANIVHALYSDVMREGLDYGVIPGTGTKPTLLLPGMEKLMRALRLRPRYVERSSVIDFEKPLFFFRYECILCEIDSGLEVASAIGSANSNESKWRWRKMERVCPACGQAAIIKGKAEYGGGWLCFSKRGGCGAKYRDGDAAIEAQEVGRTENTDLADLLNTIDKIAQKRALSSAIKGAANVSELFTVDLEDLTDYVVQQAAASITVAREVDVVTGEIVASGPNSGAAVQQAALPPQNAPTPSSGGGNGNSQKPTLAKDKSNGRRLGAEATAPAPVVPESASEAEVILADEEADAEHQTYTVRRISAQKAKSGGLMYVLHCDQGVNVTMYGGDRFRAMEFDHEPIKAANGKPVELTTPMRVRARLWEGAWQISALDWATEQIPF